MLRVANIKIDIDDSIDLVKKKLCKNLKINENDIKNFSIYKESVDARKKDKISLVYTVDIEVKNEKRILYYKNKDVKQIQTNEYHDIDMGEEKLVNQPIIVGAGPAGLFASLLLAQRGYNPILIERGADVDQRTQDIETFWKTGTLKDESNVQFGEGGAGTFSDGKLTTRMKDIRCRKVLKEFVNFGAPEDILYSHKPHVGTDILKNVVKNIRKEIIRLGGQVRFNCKLTNILIEDEQVKAIEVNNHEIIECQHLILAIGHSSRDTFRMLKKNSVHMEQKSFAMGVRIEHLQSLINNSQYGKFSSHDKLGPADYRLTTQVSNDRSVYSFCMCPGGMVIASASSKGQLVTNGMSEHARNQDNANSGLLVNIRTEDFESEDVLAGVYFQEKYEKIAFELGGSNYYAPCQSVGNFLDSEKENIIGKVKPSYKPGVKMVDLRECLPKFVADALSEGLINLDKKLHGFADDDAIMTGIETRSSSPVRINRDMKTLNSLNIKNLIPCGEGAGYAGGIVTAGVDGIKCAEYIISNFRSFK